MPGFSYIPMNHTARTRELYCLDRHIQQRMIFLPANIAENLKAKTLYKYLSILLLFIFTGCEPEEVLPIAPFVEGYTISVGPVSFEIAWNPFPQVDYYVLEVATDAEFNSLIDEEYPISLEETSKRVSNLNPETAYYFRLSAYTLSGTFINHSEPVQVVTQKLGKPIAYESPEQEIHHIQAAWAPVEEADGYQLQLAEDINFEQIVKTYDKVGRQDTVQTMDSLWSDHTYFYRVRSVKNNFTSDYSNIIIANTTSLLQPQFQSPDTITYTSATLTWQTEDQVSSYQLEVSTDPLFKDGEANTYDVELTTNTLEFPGLTPNTTYYARVRSRKDTLFSIYSEVLSFKTLALEAPTNLSLLASARQELTLSWDAVPEAEYYEADVAVDSLFRTILPSYDSYPITTESIIVTDLKPGTTYFIRVRSYGFHSYSANSILKSSTLALTAPANLRVTDLTLNHLTLEWDAAEGAKSYFIDVAADAGFNERITGYDKKEVLSTSIEVSGLSPKTTYFARVTSKHQDVLSESSETLEVPAAIPEACTITERAWDNGWVERYLYSNGRLMQIEGDSAGVNTSHYRWDIQWHADGTPNTAERYEADAGGTLLLTEIWTYGYDAGRWTSLHRKDTADITLELLQINYSANNQLATVNSFADAAATTLNYQENYTYEGGKIVEAYNDTNELVRSWKYSNYYNPESLFALELHILLRKPAAKEILGYVSAEAVSVYEQHTGGNVQRQTFVFETNPQGMPIKMYADELQTTKTYNFQSCGF